MTVEIKPAFQDQREESVLRDVQVDRSRADGVWIMRAELNEGPVEIPVYNIRADEHKKTIALKIAAYEPFVAFGCGVYGIGCAVRDPRKLDHPDTSNVFFEAKQGRDPHSRPTVLIPPKKLMPMLDRDRIHRNDRDYFANRESMEALWQNGGSWHMIAPIRESVKRLNRALVTTPEDWRNSGKPQEHWLEVNSISAIWWPDQDFEDIADMVERVNPYATIGISSFNDHGEPPAFSFDGEGGVVDFVRRKGRAPFDFVIRDSIGEQFAMKSSHPQLRPRFVDEDMHGWKAYRKGSVDVDDFAKNVGLFEPIVVLPGAALAPRAADPDVNLTREVMRFLHAVEVDYEARHRKQSIFDTFGKGRFFGHGIGGLNYGRR